MIFCYLLANTEKMCLLSLPMNDLVNLLFVGLMWGPSPRQPQFIVCVLLVNVCVCKTVV